LFYFSEDIGAGLPLFTPKGEMLRYLMESYVREVQTRYGYQHVWTGHLVKETLYHKSGHYENYRDSMFPPMVDGDTIFRLKPMNCPSHMTLFKEMGRHSYRELPMRFAEFATLYRYEDSGALSGLTRVRSLTQDDCHVFCTPEQIQAEFSRCLQLINEVLTAYKLSDYRVRLSLRGNEGKFVKDDDKWERATAALKQALDANGVVYEAVEGEAAFYGPKADFLAKDALGREWQLSTVQVDFIQPERLGVEYVGEDGQMHTPVLIHRAVTGSTERFMGVMIEHYAGAFPLWLAPTQAVIIPISDEKQGAYAQEVQAKLTALGMRVELNMSRDRMNAKIRDAQLQKHIPTTRLTTPCAPVGQGLQLRQRVHQKPDTRLRVLTQQKIQPVQIGIGHQLVGDDGALRPGRQAHAKLVHIGKGQAPGSGLQLHAKQLGRHRGLAVRGQGHAFALHKVLHPGQVVREGRAAQNGHRVSQRIVQQIPAARAQLRHRARLGRQGEAFASSVQYKIVFHGSVLHSPRGQSNFDSPTAH
jgi:hypothetical protein